MASIHLKNIGPLSDTGTIELGRFNIFIGKQSTGKSTLMKTLSFCQWLEKKIMTGDEKQLSYAYTHYSRFLRELKQFHRLSDNHFKTDSEIHYRGECIDIDLTGNKNAKIIRHTDFEEKRHNTKLSFIPSERNLVSAIKNVDKTYRSNDYDVLFNHIFEWSEAKSNTSENQPADLGIVGAMEYYYDAKLDRDIIRLHDSHETISPFYASSGVQSVLPIVVMTDYFTGPVFSKNISLSKQDIATLFSKLSEDKNSEKPEEKLFAIAKKLYLYKNCRLFIEEPEQNLFPESQQSLINYLVSKINVASQQTGMQSSLTISTHSPYVVTAFNVLISASIAQRVNPMETFKIVPQEQIISIDELRAYYIHENGTMTDIRDLEIGMISGNELDHASDCVEERLSQLNDVIYG